MDSTREANTTGSQSHDRIDFPASDPLDNGSAGADDSEDEVQTTLSQKMVSALSGSILTSLLVTPLDVVRVRLQSQPTPSRPTRPPRTFASSNAFHNLPSNIGISACCREVFWVNNNAPYCVAGSNMALLNTPAAIPRLPANCAAEEIQRKTITSTLDGLRKIARNEGPRTLWRGLTPTLIMAVPANVIYFSGYDWLRYNRKSPVRRVGVSDQYAPLVAGSSARVLAAMAVSPIEMFRTRMQASHSSNSATGVVKETFQGLKEMVAVQGPFSLWRGLTLTLWRDAPFSALYWWGYEAGRNILTDMRTRRSGVPPPTKATSPEAFARRRHNMNKENHTNTLIDSFLAGAASGGVASIVTQPFDVGKTRQQVFQHAVGGEGAAGTRRALVPEEQSMPRFLLHIFREQGMAGLFKGWAARCLKVAPACAIMISTYEIGKKMATEMNERKEGNGV
ncbi:mitochondrial carrier [Eremomyces bilateralis CBS 781.70]|uniref:Mitochondrial carrier n=1 Tax=Eremomyces bilateralis CBS 781.70 TaxID=1392243 RepID=A0A6G1FT44_9PEZI|nr:mitochondrial carrier [Eremomyces bilateralis CBS 781.70]KAF1808933.1 mitochondrial carrier [Eremomyces bilateralis CBS 781.70]